MSHQHRRRKYLINRKYQLRWTIAQVLIAVGSALISILLTLFVYFLFVKGSASNATERLVTFATIWIGIIAAFMIYAGIRITHRTAGPMYRFHQALGELANGNTSVRIYLRKRDHWHEIAEAFNDALDKIEARMAPPSETLREAAAAVTAAADRHPDDEDLKKTVELLQRFADSE